MMIVHGPIKPENETNQENKTPKDQSGMTVTVSLKSNYLFEEYVGKFN